MYYVLIELNGEPSALYVYRTKGPRTARANAIRKDWASYSSPGDKGRIEQGEITLRGFNKTSEEVL